jgi:hypothetical protein
MARLRVLAFAVALTFAVPVTAEPGVQDDASTLSSMSRFSGDAPVQIHHRGFSFPVIEYIDQTGVRQQRRGILASKSVAPGTLLGVGFYETAPKRREFIGEMNSNPAAKRKRHAAIGLSLKF